MQFNQHLEKTLLVPVATEPKQVLQKTSPETGGRGTPSQGIAIAHIIFPDIFFFKYLQPWPLAYKRLLNKPYVNEVFSRGQNLPYD